MENGDFGKKPAPEPIPLFGGGKWEKKADMPTARANLSTSVVNGKIYAIGGSVGAGTDLATVEEYDPTTNTWNKRTDMPTGRYTLATATVNEKIYVFGGSPDGRNVFPPRGI